MIVVVVNLILENRLPEFGFQKAPNLNPDEVRKLKSIFNYLYPCSFYFTCPFIKYEY